MLWVLRYSICYKDECADAKYFLRQKDVKVLHASKTRQKRLKAYTMYFPVCANVRSA